MRLRHNVRLIAQALKEWARRELRKGDKKGKGKLSYEGAADNEDTVLQAFRSSRRKLELVMDGYVMESEPLVAQMLSALGSIDLVIEEMQDTASTLGNKLPTELADTLDGVYAEALKGSTTVELSEDGTAIRRHTDRWVRTLGGTTFRSRAEVARARSVVDARELASREAALGEKMTDMKEQHDSARDMWREMNTTLSEQLEKAEGELVAAQDRAPNLQDELSMHAARTEEEREKEAAARREGEKEGGRPCPPQPTPH